MSSIETRKKARARLLSDKEDNDPTESGINTNENKLTMDCYECNTSYNIDEIGISKKVHDFIKLNEIPDCLIPGP